MFTATLQTNSAQTAVFIKLFHSTHTFTRRWQLLKDGFIAHSRLPQNGPSCLTRPEILPETRQNTYIPNNGSYRLVTRSYELRSLHIQAHYVTRSKNVYKQYHNVTDIKTHFTFTQKHTQNQSTLELQQPSRGTTRGQLAEADC
jgi:hypothetical protein